MKFQATWTYAEPNVIKASYKISFELLDENKKQLLEQYKNDKPMVDWFLNIWSNLIIRAKYPETCKLHDPVILSVVSIDEESQEVNSI